MIINSRSINDEKIWEAWDLKNYVNNFIISSNPAELRTRPFWDSRKNSKNSSRYSEKIWNIRALEKSPIFSFFALGNVRVLFKNQRKSEKWWGKRWEFNKRIGEQSRKAVENECFGKIFHFLTHVPKPTENLRKCLKKFWEILRKLLRKSEKYFYQGVYNIGYNTLQSILPTWSKIAKPFPELKKSTIHQVIIQEFCNLITKPTPYYV